MSAIAPSVNLWDLSFADSNVGLLVGGAALGACAVLAAPTVAAAAGVAIAPWALTAIKVVVAVGILFVAIAFRHRFYYDLSLLYTVCTQSQWWHEISPDVVLGAIPLTHHVDKLKEQGITHVITLLEDFELQRGIIHPATKPLWEQHGIEHIHMPTRDFEAVPVDTIQTVTSRMRDIRQANPQAKFYIHCKAGRGRSASIVVAHRLFPKLSGQQRAELKQLVDQEIALVKAIRKAINLNSKQQATVLAYCESQLSVT